LRKNSADQPRSDEQSSGATKLPSSGSNIKVPPKKLCAIRAKTQMIRKSLKVMENAMLNMRKTHYMVKMNR